MITRAPRLLVLLFISVLGASCAEGTNLVPNVGGDAGPPPGAGQPQCGNGMVETGEMCECAVGSTDACKVTDKTCADLGAGTGPLLCEPTMCVYLDDACAGGAGGTGGGGTQG